MVAYKLVYFNVRGLGEPIRIIFQYAGVDFEDKKLTFEEFPAYKQSTKIINLNFNIICNHSLID